jgi:hypothetical protein
MDAPILAYEGNRNYDSNFYKITMAWRAEKLWQLTEETNCKSK